MIPQTSSLPNPLEQAAGIQHVQRPREKRDLAVNIQPHSYGSGEFKYAKSIGYHVTPLLGYFFNTYKAFFNLHSFCDSFRSISGCYLYIL